MGSLIQERDEQYAYCPICGQRFDFEAGGPMVHDCDENTLRRIDAARGRDHDHVVCYNLATRLRHGFQMLSDDYQ